VRTEPTTKHAASRAPAAIELHIEELVLHGFAPGDRARIADAVQSELTRLFAEQGVPASLRQGGAVAELDAGTFVAHRDAGADRIGGQVALAIRRGLTVGRRAGR
jgi:hypothetical protein